MFTQTLSAIAYFEILLPLALILLCTKLFSLLGKKIGLPQVVGMLIAGILLGFIKYIPNQNIFTQSTMEGLSFLAKIGVILIMFSAGLETDLKQFKTSGLPSVLITILGVLFPLGLGFLVASAFNGGFNVSQHQIITNLFYGAILAATSVSITVAALKELGKLNTKVGTSIVAAAILDDIIGVVLLSLFISLDKGNGLDGIGIAIGKMIGFFAAAIAVGFVAYIILKHYLKRHPEHHRRIPIIGFAMAFFFAYAAEEWFGVADITGAYVAGIMLSTLTESDYIDRKVEVSNYMIFAPVFFCKHRHQRGFRRNITCNRRIRFCVHRGRTYRQGAGMRHRLAHLQILVYGQLARGHRHDGKSGSRAGMHAKRRGQRTCGRVDNALCAYPHHRVLPAHSSAFETHLQARQNQRYAAQSSPHGRRNGTIGRCDGTKRFYASKRYPIASRPS